MSYLYYPGCSLKSTGRAYEESMLTVFDSLNIDLNELDDWNCCGATAYMSISELKAFALSARNFALAEKQAGGSGPVDMVIPCAACYLGLNKAKRYLNDHQDVREIIEKALRQAGLEYKGNVRVRHPLDLLLNDIGLDTIRAKVERPLEGLKVACYYGCQIIRPYADFDDQHNPRSMDDLMTALGAEVIDWPLKTRCCGGSLTGTVQDVGLRLSYLILKEAKKRGADTIATACPLCQFNLECYRNKMKDLFEEDLRLPSVYFTQLMGTAFGLSPKELGINRLFIPFTMPVTAGAGEGGRHAGR
jgi:heterodisulfide reductase subunit B